MSEINYVYIFVRTNISLAQQIVQAAHVACTAGEEFGGSDSHMVILGVAALTDLETVMNELCRSQIQFVKFTEPDNDMGDSAVATKPIPDKDRRQIKKIIDGLGLKLWS